MKSLKFKLLRFFYRIKRQLEYHFIYRPKETLFKIKDYDRLAHDYSNVVCFATDGKMSKTNYDLNTIYGVINSTQAESYYSVVKDDVKMIISEGGTIDDIQKYIDDL